MDRLSPTWHNVLVCQKTTRSLTEESVWGHRPFHVSCGRVIGEMGRRFLIVDDDRAGCEALADALRTRLAGVLVDTCESAQAAEILLESTHYDLVVCDVLMPGTDGLTVLRESRRLRPNMPIILITAGGVDREEAALYAGAYAFVEKPIDLDRFISIVNAALEFREMDHRLQERNFRSLLNLRMKAGAPDRYPSRS
jgi:DNA-binding NtrC family response regulator